MRTIKFRGLHSDNKKWVYGLPAYYLSQFSDKITGIEYEGGSMSEVITETVGQFTGLLDKNGKEIYEGDVIQSPNTTHWVIEWDNWNSCFHGRSLSVIMSTIDHVNCEVIGNIHQNPELL